MMLPCMRSSPWVATLDEVVLEERSFAVVEVVLAAHTLEVARESRREVTLYRLVADDAVVAAVEVTAFLEVEV